MFVVICYHAIGLRSIPTIAECACVRSHCYRVSNFEGFPEQYTDAKGNTATRTKVCIHKWSKSEDVVFINPFTPSSSQSKNSRKSEISFFQILQNR